MASLTLPTPLAHIRDGNGEDPQRSYIRAYNDQMGEFLDAAYQEGAASQQEVPELKEIANALDYLSGLQWKEAMPSYRAKPVSNEFMSMFWEAIGLLTDVKPMFQIEEFGGSGEYSKTQSILNSCARGWAKNSRFERRLAFCTMFGMLTSAPAKVYWNPFAKGYAGDPQDGDIWFEHIPPSSLIRLGIDTYDDIQGDEMVIYRRMRTIQWIRRAYPRMGLMVKPEEKSPKYTVDNQSSVNVSPNTFYPVLSGGMRRLMGMPVNNNTVESVYPKAEVREFWMKDASVNETKNNIWMGPRDQAWGYWVKPGEMFYPRGRLIVRANGVTLYDEPNCYYHRKFPFSLLGLYAVPWQQYAMSVVNPWIKQQDILNQIMSGVLQCVKKMVNPPLLAAKSAIHPEALRAIDSSKPGLKISYSQNAPAPPSWGQPPNVPPLVMQTYGTIIQSMRRMSGSDVMDAAAGKKQVPGADTMDRMTFSKTTPIRLMGRNMEDFVNEIGTMWAQDALQFYTAEHRMEMMGAAGLTKEDMDDRPGSLIPQGISSEGFVRRWKFTSDKGTLLNVQRQDRLQIAFALRKNHDISRQGLYRILDWNVDVKQIEDELGQEAEATARAMAAAGIKPGAHGKK
jgi:hypothetical protein